VLLHFYIFALVPLIFFLALNLLKSGREIVNRSLTLIALLHIICLAMWQGPLAFGALVVIIYTLGLYELSSHYNINRFIMPIAGLLVFILTYQYPDQLLYTLPLFYLVTFTAFWGQPKWINHPVFLIGFMLFFLLPCTVFLIQLMEIHVGNIILILWLLQLNDTFGLLFGKKFGKTHPFKTISPNKSLEGYIFGGIGIGIGIYLLHTYIPVLTSWDPYRALTLFALFFILGNAGDLLFSSLKRKLGIKDFSSILPGHGGVLDRFDNILFIAPTLYLFLWLGGLNI